MDDASMVSDANGSVPMMPLEQVTALLQVCLMDMCCFSK